MENIDKEVTAFIDVLGGDEDMALEERFTTVYEELRRLAHAQRRRWSGLNTLSTTALVHEAYVRLSQQDSFKWRDRGHFLRIAARAMRFIVINYVEHSRTAKRGGEHVHVSADETTLAEETGSDDLLALDEALNQLAGRYPRWARVVECRVFGGLDVEETAEALDVSPTTVKRDWRRAQGWLYGMMNSD